MSFGFAAALLVGLLVAAPFAAHLLRRGRTREFEFPGTHLVPETPPTSKKRSRLDDRVLLSLRSLLVLALAVLGATPFVQCSRLSVARTSGANVALAIIVDDSHSMRSLVQGTSRWERAVTGAEELLGSTRSGDAIAIVLGGRPARVALSATTDRDAVRRTLREITVSDRATDIADAVKLARSSLVDLPQIDRRVVLLSDLGGEEVPDGEPPVSSPLGALGAPAPNCALTACTEQGGTLTAEVACTDGAAAEGRNLSGNAKSKSAPELPTPAGGSSATGESAPKTTAPKAPESAPLAARGGLQSVELGVPSGTNATELRLSGADADASDDVCPVGSATLGAHVAIVADATRASTITGGPTVIEQALRAVRPTVHLRPLTLAPETAEDLEGFGTMVLDDPAGLSPDQRASLTYWVEQGGVAVALLGPRAGTSQLASNLTPFVEGAAVWESFETSKSLETIGATWFGEAAASLVELRNRGRAIFGSGVPSGALVRAAWEDGQPWLLERRLGQGAVFSVGLPASVELSDFALRPAFIALLDRVLGEADSRGGPRRSLAGTTWRFPAGSEPVVTGPGGKLRLAGDSDCDSAQANCASGQAFLSLEVSTAGRYIVKQSGREHSRIVDLDPEEVLAPPRQSSAGPAQASAWTQSSVDISGEFALVVLCLFAAELIFRSLSKRREV
jgi:hypothetical protein